MAKWTKIPHVFICTWFQLHMNPLIFWLSSVAPWPHSQTMTCRVSCPATPGDFKLSPYCSTYQRRLGSKMWGWKLATLEKQRSNQLIFAFGQRHSKRPISSPIHTHKKRSAKHKSLSFPSYMPSLSKLLASLWLILVS